MATDTEPGSNMNDAVEVISSDKPCMKMIPFSVAIPEGLDYLDPDGAPSSNTSSASTVIGRITILGSSIMIWMGWNLPQNQSNSNTIRHELGPLVIAAPPLTSKYTKASTSSSSSQLIGSNSDEDQMLALQISTRMSKIIGIPVLVSTSLHSMSEHTIEQQMGGMAIGNDENGQGSLTSGPLVIRAAALAERKIKKLLLDWKKEKGQV